jgi:RNA polymerase sigma-70 factor (ECF subfamily)
MTSSGFIMDNSSLELLLEKLCSGDAEAAGRVFVAFEPYLRKVVRRLLPPSLRAKFDSADVVQSVWADLVVRFREPGWRFEGVDHLRAFLIQVTRNRFLDRVRGLTPALAREELLADRADRVPAPEPRPSEWAQAEEVWQKILALCPPAHQEILRLRREGLSRVEIAARTGMNEGSIRRILRGLARQVASFHAADARPS